MTKILSKGEIEGFSCANCGAQKFYQDKDKHAFRCMYCDSEYFYKEELEEPVKEIKKESPVVEAKEETPAEQESYTGYLYGDYSERRSAIINLVTGTATIAFSIFVLPHLAEGTEPPISGIFSIIKPLMLILSSMFIVLGVFRAVRSFYV